MTKADRLLRERYLRLSNDPNWFYNQGHWYKIRTIFQISKRLQEALDIHQKLTKGPWHKWFADASAVGHFYGIEEDDYSIYNVSDEGYSRNSIHRTRINQEDKKKLIQIAENTDLPLMLEDPEYQDCRAVIEARLKGDLPAIVHREDLIKEHDRLESRFHHMRSVIGVYREFLKDYVMRKFRELVYDKYRRSLIIVLNVEGCLYHYFTGRSVELDVADNVEYYTVTADEKCYEARNR